MKSKFAIKFGIIFLLVIAVVVFIFQNKDNCTKAMNSDNDVDNYIELLKNENDSVKYYSLEQLYDALDNISENTWAERKKIIAFASDEVIDAFFSNEQMKSFEVLENFDSSFEGKNDSTNNKISLEYGDDVYELNVRENYYAKGDSLKKVVSATSKYGIETVREMYVEKIEDDGESEENEEVINRGRDWKLVDKWTSSCFKDYGDYKFVFKDETSCGDLKLFGVTSIFKYNISEEGLKAISINGKVPNHSGNICYYIGLKENKIKDKVATHVDENINGTIVYKLKDKDKLKVTQYKQNMVVTIKIWRKDYMKMETEHYVAEYKEEHHLFDD